MTSGKANIIIRSLMRKQYVTILKAWCDKPCFSMTDFCVAEVEAGIELLFSHLYSYFTLIAVKSLGLQFLH